MITRLLVFALATTSLFAQVDVLTRRNVAGGGCLGGGGAATLAPVKSIIASAPALRNL